MRTQPFTSVRKEFEANSRAESYLLLVKSMLSKFPTTQIYLDTFDPAIKEKCDQGLTKEERELVTFLNLDTPECPKETKEAIIKDLKDKEWEPEPQLLEFNNISEVIKEIENVERLSGNYDSGTN